MQKLLSVYLDLLRFTAAMLVFIVHANYDRFTGGLPGLWRVGTLGNDAVMIFFVLSGFVIAYVSETREKNGALYFTARISRLWSIAIPALLLTITLDYTGKWLAPEMYNGDWFQDSNPAFRVIANIFFINELWFWSIRPFSNGPYWSIGYEFWYYAIYAASFFLEGKTRYFTIGFLAILVGPKILLLFPVWWAGVWAYRTNLANNLSKISSIFLFFITIIFYLVARLTGVIDHLDDVVKYFFGNTFVSYNLKWSQYFLSSYLIGFLLAINFIAMRRISCILNLNKIPLERVITYLASFTFSLYLFHYPLLQFFAALCDYSQIKYLKTSIVILGTLTVVWILGSWAERQKYLIREIILNLTKKFQM